MSQYIDFPTLASYSVQVTANTLAGYIITAFSGCTLFINSAAAVLPHTLLPGHIFHVEHAANSDVASNVRMIIPPEPVTPAPAPVPQAVYLSTSPGQTSLILRAPTVAALGGEGGGVTAKAGLQLRPNADTTLLGLSDATLQGSGKGIAAEVWRMSTQQRLGRGAEVTLAERTGATYQSLFPSPVLLLAGVDYAVVWTTTDASAPGDIKSCLSNSAAGSVKTTFPGFTTDNIVRYTPNPLNYPDQIFGQPDSYPVTFDLVTAAAPHAKNVTGPLDPRDFPVVAAPTPGFPEHAVEIVAAPGAAPYLRTIHGGAEFRLPFTVA